MLLSYIWFPVYIILIFFYHNCSGHVKDSNKKDCVLIIDHETGEVTIERLASQARIIYTN